MRDEVPYEGRLREVLVPENARLDCPPAERWLDLLSGSVEDAEADRLRGHLADCRGCAKVARDARRFLLAMDEPIARVREHRVLALRWTAAAAVALGVGSVLLLGLPERTRAGAVARLATDVDIAAPVLSPPGAADQDLVFRGGGVLERIASLDAALVPYRGSAFGAACAALREHARRFPADREGRFFAAVACLEAGELEPADELLASLAVSSGERSDEARELLGRLRRARTEDEE